MPYNDTDNICYKMTNLTQVVSADGNEVDMKTIITQSRISEKYSLLSAPQLYPSTKQQSDIAVIRVILIFYIIVLYNTMQFLLKAQKIRYSM